MRTARSYIRSSGSRAVRTVQIVICLALCRLCCAFADGTNTGYADWRATGYVKLNRVQMTGVRLISSEQDFHNNFEARDFAAFDREIADAVDRSVGTTNDTFQAVVQVQLTKDRRPSFEIASTNPVPRGFLREASNSLVQLPDYRSRTNDFRYELQFTIHKSP
jgi:hypothetical protein